MGTVRQRGLFGAATHRLGPALSLCPLAYLRGVTYFRLLVERLLAHSGRTDLAGRAQPLLEGLDVLLDRWPSYRSAIVDLDEQMWASALPVPTQVTVLALDREGSPTWWIWDLTRQLFTRAREPEGTADTKRAVRACQQQIKNFRPIFWGSRTHITVVLWDVVTTPVSPNWSSSGYFVDGEKPDGEYAAKHGFSVVHRDEWAPPPVLTSLTPGGLHPMRLGPEAQPVATTPRRQPAHYCDLSGTTPTSTTPRQHGTESSSQFGSWSAVIRRAYFSA